MHSVKLIHLKVVHKNFRQGLFGPTWVNLGQLGSTWVYLGLPGSTWVYLGLPGSTWVHLGPPGSTSIELKVSPTLPQSEKVTDSQGHF